ncbi:unnamed protein product [Lymnaea stagnalis]|uniref:Uncharacterized protein n=1 Tax=Lymnaea stagnalis TaxID=6523 RepID=A0AAV2I8M1_LYMST
MGCTVGKEEFIMKKSDTTKHDSDSKQKKNHHKEEKSTQPVPMQGAQTVPPIQEKKHVDLSDGDIKKRLKRYLSIQKEIHEWEGKNLPKNLQAKKEESAHLLETLAESEKSYQAACDKVAKVKADVDKMKNPSVKAFFKDQKEFDEKMSKEQEELLEAVSEQEVAKKQLEGIQNQKKALDKEIHDKTGDLNKLMALYDEQDKILNDIFKGKYGSALENTLEEEVDQLLDRKERIGMAKYKWSNGKILLQHACNQLGYAVKRWQDLMQVPGNNMQVKYQLATETRNNLIAASQNITTAQRYLNNIKFPYCEPEEIDTLNRACSNIYIDMQSQDRHQHALQCYSVTHKRCGALLQWFDSVIDNTIEKDLAKAKAELSPKEHELRKERLRLIKERIGGDTSDIKIPEKGRGKLPLIKLNEFIYFISHVHCDGGGLNKTTKYITMPNAVIFQNKTIVSTGKTVTGKCIKIKYVCNIEQLKKQHEQEMAQIEKAQETNKARIEQGLQEKLRERRTKRSRLQEE